MLYQLFVQKLVLASEGGAAASYVQPQTIIVKEKSKSSPGYGKMAAGLNLQKIIIGIVEKFNSNDISNNVL